MGETADSVVVELEARLGNYQAQVSQGANAFDQSMKRMQNSASQTEQHVGRAFGNTRIAQMEMQHVITASSDAFAAGIPIQRIFASEMGRIAEAVTMAGGSMGKFGAFIGGPWGIALQVGIGLLTALYAAHQKTAEGSKDTRDAEEKLADALMGRKTATDELLKASQDLEAQQSKALQSTALQIEHEYTLADATMKTAIATREKLKAELELALHEERQAMQALEHPAAGTRAEAGDLGRVQSVSAAQGNIADLTKQIDDQTTLIATASKAAAEAMARFAREVDTHVGRINAQFDARQKALEAQFTARAAAALAAGDRAGAARINAQAQAAEHNLNVERLKSVETARKLDDVEAGKGTKPHFGRDIDEANNARLLTAAQRYSGLSESTAGGRSSLEQLFAAANIHVDPKMVAWCAAFVNSVLATQGLPGTGSLAAKSFETYGSRVTGEPQKGDIVTLKLGGSQAVNHVGFFAGFDGKGNVRVTGGNQGNEVNTETFNKNSVASFRRAPTADAVQRLAHQAEATAARAANDDRAYQAELGQAQDRYAKAMLALADTAEGRYALEIEELRTGKAQRDIEIDDQVKAGKINAAQGQKLKDLNAEIEAAQEVSAKRAEEAAIIDRHLEHERSVLNLEEASLQLQDRLASTRQEHLRIALQLLDYQEREARATLNAAIAKEQDAGRRADLQAQATRLGPDFAMKRAEVSRQDADPLVSYMNELRSHAGDMNDALKSVEVDGLRNIEDGLLGVISGTESVASAFKKMVMSILADLARMEIEKTILSFLSKINLGGGGPDTNSLIHITSLGSGPGLDGYTPPPGRAAGGPVIPGKLYRVNETGVEGFRPAGSGDIIPLGQIRGASGGGTTVIQPVNFDLRGAVMTEDILAQMNALAEQAAMRGAIGGMALTQREAARAASRRLA